MGQIIRLTEEDLTKMVKEMVNEVISELSYGEYQKKAHDAISGIRGSIMKSMDNSKFNKLKRQERIFGDADNDRIDDEWEIVYSSLRKNDHSYPELYYTIKNTRTGETRNLSTFGSMKDPFDNWTMNGKYVKPRGKIINGKPGTMNPCYDDADYLNNGGVSKYKQPKQYYLKHD